MTTSDPGCRSDPSGPSITHPGHPIVDDKTAVLIDQATIELTLLRSPAALGDSLADLHAMVSLLAQRATDSAGFWRAMAAGLAAFFLLSSQAMPNYWFLVAVIAIFSSQPLWSSEGGRGERAMPS